MTNETPTVRTRSAYWGYDDHQYFGYPVFKELAGRESFTGLIALSVLGRRISAGECALLDDVSAVITLADPRIWPLKLTRLVASYGRTGPALAAGLLILEEGRIGPWSTGKTAQMLVELQARLSEQGAGPASVASVVGDYIKTRSFAWGFGTPFRACDERLVAFRECMRNRQREDLPYWRTMTAIIEPISNALGVEPNISLGVAAAFLDLGIAVQAVGPLTLALTSHMFLAHAVEGAKDASEVLRELPPAFIKYVGRPSRTSPRFDAARMKAEPRRIDTVDVQ